MIESTVKSNVLNILGSRLPIILELRFPFVMVLDADKGELEISLGIW